MAEFFGERQRVFDERQDGFPARLLARHHQAHDHGAIGPGAFDRLDLLQIDVQRSVAQLVLTIVEFLRRLMERQAIRRMEQKTLSRREVEAVGDALMTLEDTVREIGRKFGLTPEDLNLDLGPLGKLM